MKSSNRYSGAVCFLKIVSFKWGAAGARPLDFVGCSRGGRAVFGVVVGPAGRPAAHAASRPDGGLAGHVGRPAGGPLASTSSSSGRPAGRPAGRPGGSNFDPKTRRRFNEKHAARATNKQTNNGIFGAYYLR